MTDLETGIAVGMLLAAKKGSEPTPEPETDEDFEAFKNSADPSENQTIFTVYADINTPYNIATLTATCNVISGATAYLNIDWGDGTSETFDLTTDPQTSVQINHTYSSTGNFILTVTSTNLEYCDFWQLTSVANSIFWRTAKYGEKIHAEKYSQGIGTLPLTDKLRFVKIPNDTDFSAGSFFKNCYSLSNVIYNGDNLTSIPSYMFYNCNCLKFDDWDFSEVTGIDEYAFYNCVNLTSISIPLCERVGNYAFQNTFLESVKLPVCTTLGTYVFNSCRMLKSANIPKCQTIPNYAFNGCANLMSISIPKCESVGNNAFTACRFTEINIPLCTSVGNYGFNGCYYLKNTTFADGCTFGTNVFNACRSLFPKPDGTF